MIVVDAGSKKARPEVPYAITSLMVHPVGMLISRVLDPISTGYDACVGRRCNSCRGSKLCRGRGYVEGVVM